MFSVLRLGATLLVVGRLQLATCRAGFVDVSGDGFFRPLMTRAWRQDT